MEQKLITPEILTRIAPTIKGEKAITISTAINLIAPRYGLTTKNQLEEFLATILHESGEFSIQAENMNYTTANRLMQIWPNHFKTVAFANQYIKNPRKLANYIYGPNTSIGKSLQNVLPDDGWNFRGSGPQQLTGRYSFSAFGTYIKFKGTLYELADLIRTDYYWGIESACWEFCINKKLIKLAEQNDFLTITKKINGGTVGWESRVNYLKKVKKYL